MVVNSDWVGAVVDPAENGYYWTYYWNGEHNKTFYKPLYWCSAGWQFPRNINFTVVAWKQPRYDYYTKALFS